MDERHLVWRRASDDYDQLEKLAPEGFAPVVEVYLHGRTEPVEATFVETRRDGWIRLEAAHREHSEEGRPDPSDVWIHVPQENLARIEIRFRQITPSQHDRRPVGFVHSALDE